jgi:hypothetical protein
VVLTKYRKYEQDSFNLAHLKHIVLTKGRAIHGLLHLALYAYNRVIGKVRHTQHQNRKFGHTQGETKTKPSKKVH